MDMPNSSNTIEYYYEVIKQEEYISEEEEDEEASSIIGKTEKTHGENENEQYRILDISSRTVDHLSYEQQAIYTEDPQENEEYKEAEYHEEEFYYEEEEDEEQQGVLHHKWENEDPNADSDDEMDDANKELKVQMSNIVKFINFLNRLLEDHQTFMSIDINDKAIESQKQNLALDAHMLGDYVRNSFECSNYPVNESVFELKKLLAVKIEILDKLCDKLVNGAVPEDVVKRLFSGNNILIKAQIEELRRTLFAKLDKVNKIHLLNVQKAKIAKQAKRKAAKTVSYEVLEPKSCRKANTSKLQTLGIKAEKNVAHNFKQKQTLNMGEKYIFIDTLVKPGRPRKETFTNNIYNVNDELLHDNVVYDGEHGLYKVDESPASLDNYIKEDAEVELSSKCQVDKETSPLADFDSFTQVISKKLNLKPEEASPSSILTKFRNNLNKKLQQNVAQTSEMEFNLANLKEEEDYVVEEVYIVEPDTLFVDENEQFASNPEPCTYSINNIELTKVPTLPYVLKRNIDFNLMNNMDSENSSCVLHNLDIEKVLLQDRTKALLQIQAMDNEPSISKKEKVMKKRNNLLDRLDKITTDAELAKKCLFTLDKQKGRPCKKMLANPVISHVLKRPWREIENVIGNEESKFSPYIYKRRDTKLAPWIVEIAPPDENIPEVQNKPETNDDIDNKLRSLFKNNNLKGNLMKWKISDSREFEELDCKDNDMKVVSGDFNCAQSEQVQIESAKKIRLTLDGTKKTLEKERAKLEFIRTKNYYHSQNIKAKLPKFNLPRRNQKSFLQKLRASNLYHGSTPMLKPPFSAKSKAKTNEVKLEGDKCKELLTRLKQKIFDKMHSYEEKKSTIDIKLELEKRFRKREKMKD